MLGHERLCAGVEVVHKDHGVVREGLGREHLSQGDQVRVAQLLPLVHDVHTLGVDEPVAVDSAEADVRAGLHVGGLVGWCRYLIMNPPTCIHCGPSGRGTHFA